jgi:hypothetical protein
LKRALLTAEMYHLTHIDIVPIHERK